MKKIVTAFIVLVSLSLVWYFVFPSFKTKEVQEDAPLTSETLENGFKRESLGIISRADLMPSAHEVTGQVYLVEGIDGKIYLRFENFEIINGPDVRVLLSDNLEKNGAIELGPLKGTHGNFNYEVPSDLNLEDYSKILIWCEDFKILFAYADFTK